MAPGSIPARQSLGVAAGRSETRRRVMARGWACWVAWGRAPHRTASGEPRLLTAPDTSLLLLQIVTLGVQGSAGTLKVCLGAGPGNLKVLCQKVQL